MKWKNIRKAQITKTDPRTNTKFEYSISITEIEFVIKKNPSTRKTSNPNVFTDEFYQKCKK